MKRLELHQRKRRFKILQESHLKSAHYRNKEHNHHYFRPFLFRILALWCHQTTGYKVQSVLYDGDFFF